MNYSNEWERFWIERSGKTSSDYDFDHGAWPGNEIEKLSEQELINFIDPNGDEIIFDAGCGTGSNIQLLSSKVRQIIGVDYCPGAVDRCQRRIASRDLRNATVMQGRVTDLTLGDHSVDKVLCLSVLQYMDDTEVIRALTEFKRILTAGGILVLHVKNLSSLYLSSLWAIKRLKLLFGKQTKLEYYRSFRWYLKALTALGFEIVNYNSFSLFRLEKLPDHLVFLLRRFELRNYNKGIFRLGFVRRHGAELKIKARVVKAS